MSPFERWVLKPLPLNVKRRLARFYTKLDWVVVVRHVAGSVR